MGDTIAVPAFIGFEDLPFTVAPARHADELRQLLELRVAAYSRHGYSEHVTDAMLQPDATDLAGTSTTLVAVCKTTGKVLGSIRISCNMDGGVPIPPGLDAPCLAGSYAYIDRFCVSAGAAPLVARMLMKGLWLYALSREARVIVALARRGMARRHFRHTGLDLLGDPAGVLLPELHADPYYLVGAPVGKLTQNLQERDPTWVPLVAAVHPDIQVHATQVPWSLVGSQP